MNDAVDEVIAVAAKEGIDADIVKGGVLHVARNPAQAAPAGARGHEPAHEAGVPSGPARRGPRSSDRVRHAPGPASPRGARTARGSSPPSWSGGSPTPSSGSASTIYEGTAVTADRAGPGA